MNINKRSNKNGKCQVHVIHKESTTFHDGEKYLNAKRSFRLLPGLFSNQNCNGPGRQLERERASLSTDVGALRGNLGVAEVVGGVRAPGEGGEPGARGAVDVDGDLLRRVAVVGELDVERVVGSRGDPVDWMGS